MKHGYEEFKISVPAGCGKTIAERLSYDKRLHHDARLRGASSGGIPALGIRTRLCLWGERIDRTDWENWRINYYGM